MSKKEREITQLPRMDVTLLSFSILKAHHYFSIYYYTRQIYKAAYIIRPIKVKNNDNRAIHFQKLIWIYNVLLYSNILEFYFSGNIQNIIYSLPLYYFLCFRFLMNKAFLPKETKMLFKLVSEIYQNIKILFLTFLIHK